METRCVLLKLCVWLVLLTSTADSQNCTSGYEFTLLPPTELNCNPVGIVIRLQCDAGSTSDIVTWYWTQNVCEAGVNGTAILPGDNSDNYQVSQFGTHSKQIGFVAGVSTLGYYWCEISNAVNVSLRPSTITPVLPPTNMSLPSCTVALVISSHSGTTECAEKDSPTVHSRLFIPSSCVPPQLKSSFSDTAIVTVDIQLKVASSTGLQTLLGSPSTSSILPSVASSTGLQTLLDSPSISVSVPLPTPSPDSSTVIIIAIAVAVFIVLTALGLVLLLVIIWNFRRRRTKSFTRSTTDTLKRPSNGVDDVEMMQNEAYSVVLRTEPNVVMMQNEAYSTVLHHKPLQKQDTYEHIYW